MDLTDVIEHSVRSVFPMSEEQRASEDKQDRDSLTSGLSRDFFSVVAYFNRYLNVDEICRGGDGNW